MLKTLYITGDEVEYITTCNLWDSSLVQTNNLPKEISDITLRLQCHVKVLIVSFHLNMVMLSTAATSLIRMVELCRWNGRYQAVLIAWNWWVAQWVVKQIYTILQYWYHTNTPLLVEHNGNFYGMMITIATIQPVRRLLIWALCEVLCRVFQEIWIIVLDQISFTVDGHLSTVVREHEG